MPSKMSQTLRARACVPPQDISAAKTGSFVDITAAQRVMAVITTASIAATKKVTAQLLQAQDAAGTGAKNLGAAVSKTAGTGGAALDLTIDATVESMDAGFNFISMSIVSDNGAAVYGSGMLLLGGNRYNP